METNNPPRSMQTASLLLNVKQDLETLSTSTIEAFLLIEPNGVILDANTASEKWLQMSKEALIGKNFFKLLTPHGAPVREWVHQAISNKTIFETAYQNAEIFFRIRLVPVADPSNKIIRLVIICQDMSDQKKAEAQVRELTSVLERKVYERTGELEILNKRLSEEKRRAELLVEFSRHLMEDTHNYRYLLDHLTERIAGLIGDVCIVAIFTTGIIELEVLSITGRDTISLPSQRSLLFDHRINIEGNKIVEGILKGKSFSARNLSPERGMELLPREFASLIRDDGLKALEVLPLQAGNEPIGLLAVGREHGDPYSEVEISFLNGLSSPIALTIQNARLLEQLTLNQDQLRGLSKQLVRMQENQYSHLAKELHDRVGQDMTAININLSIIRTLLPATISPDAVSRLDDTFQLVEKAVGHMRSTMAEFRPPMLDEYGLTAALYWYSEQYSRRTNIPVNIDDRYLEKDRLLAEIEIALFRICQEALNNIAKHANASQVNIELLENEDNILLTITDNGKGFDVDRKSVNSPDHWGLTIMRERARAINGRFIIRSVLGRGTQILVRVEKRL